MPFRALLASLALLAAGPGATAAEPRPRARDLGVPFDGTPGPLNAVTDVAGVEVGYRTLVAGQGRLQVGVGPVRTGVTVVLPRGKSDDAYPAAWHSLNGDGELTGVASVEDFGTGSGPIGITNTNSVGVVRDAIGAWSVRHFSDGRLVDYSFGLPIVGETWDGVLNDTNGFHVGREDVVAALDGARGGPVAEGNVGGGTGMVLYGFKGGSGTASRVFTVGPGRYTLGVFVQANFGQRQELRIAGVPVGRAIPGHQPVIHARERRRRDGSCIAVVVTDAPLLPSQLKLVARRVAHGIARTGTFTHNGSGEIFLAVSTARPAVDPATGLETWRAVPKEQLDPVFQATVEASEEAIVNALVAAEDMEGVDGNKVFALPHDALRRLMKEHEAAGQGARRLP